MTVKNIILWDIDGVLADCDHRLHHILEAPANWDAFDAETHLDRPIRNMIRLYNLCATNPFIELILITDRANRGNVRLHTKQWLINNGVQGFNKLHMRADKDHRPALKVKLDICEANGYTPDSVLTFFEDQPDTIKGFREAGYHVCDVGGWQDEYTEILTEGGPDEE